MHMDPETQTWVCRLPKTLQTLSGEALQAPLPPESPHLVQGPLCSWAMHFSLSRGGCMPFRFHSLF